MSIEAIAWVLNKAPCDSPAQKLVLIALANHARPDGTTAFPAVSTISRYTALSERTIRYHLDALEDLGLIQRCDPKIVAAYITRSDRRPIGFNLMLSRVREVQEAHPDDERGASDDTDGVHLLPNGVQMTTERGAAVAPETYITIQEPSLRTVSPTRAEATRLCHLLCELMVLNGCKAPTVTNQWIEEMDKILRLDERPEAEVEACIRWSQADPFWRSNILSPKKLRMKFDQMKLQAERQRFASRPKGFAGIMEFVNDEQA